MWITSFEKADPWGVLRRILTITKRCKASKRNHEACNATSTLPDLFWDFFANVYESMRVWAFCKCMYVDPEHMYMHRVCAQYSNCVQGIVVWKPCIRNTFHNCPAEGPKSTKNNYNSGFIFVSIRKRWSLTRG